MMEHLIQPQDPEEEAVVNQLRDIWIMNILKKNSEIMSIYVSWFYV